MLVTDRRQLILVAAAASLLAACSPLEMLSAVSPSGHYERVADVQYGEAERQFLDVYKPTTVMAEAPLVIYFYGGGWADGHKEEFEFVASSLTRAGMIVAIPDYPLYPDVVFPT